VLAVTSVERSPLLPELPSVSESGLPGFEVSGWIAMYAPAATPPAIVRALNRGVSQVLSLPDLRQKFAADGAESTPDSPEQSRHLLMVELDKWARLIRDRHLKF